MRAVWCGARLQRQNVESRSRDGDGDGEVMSCGGGGGDVDVDGDRDGVSAVPGGSPEGTNIKILHFNYHLPSTYYARLGSPRMPSYRSTSLSLSA